jgi:transposase
MAWLYLAAGSIASPDDPNRPPEADRKTGTPCDFAMDRWRRLIENFFCNFKQWRGIATRYDKTARVLPP